MKQIHPQARIHRRGTLSSSGAQALEKTDTGPRITLVSTTRSDKKRGLRGNDDKQLDVFSYINSEQRVPQDHPLRSLRAMTDEALQQLAPRFNHLYAKTGRPSICAGEVVASAPAASIVLGAKRADVDGTTQLQSAVPLGSWA